MSLTQAQLGARIARARQDNGLSQADLAREIGATSDVVERIERGERPIFSFEVQRIAAATGKRPNWFLSLEQSPLESQLRAAASVNDDLADNLYWLADLARDDRLLRQLVADIK